MTACDDEAEAQRITQALGSLMLALARRMPQLGWRLLADALAGIQIRLLDAPKDAGDLAQENTRQLFAALRASLPAEQYRSDPGRHPGRRSSPGSRAGGSHAH